MNRRDVVKLLGLSGIALCMPYKGLATPINKVCKVCQKAWNSLGRFNAKRYQFRYQEPTTNLPKVFLYGDSISIGYTEYVRASLKGQADVMRLHTNGNSSQTFIPKMEAFKKALFQPFLKGGWTFSWDVIHFNVGLHDLKYLANKKLNKKEGKQVSSLEEYETNLKNIIQYLKTTYPKTKLVFATTTPVPEGEPGRFVGDAIKYNEVALKVMNNHSDIIVNDLFTFSVPVLKKYALKLGDVHYKPEGSRLQGIHVAKIIANAINIKPIECPSTKEIKAQFKEYESKNNK